MRRLLLGAFAILAGVGLRAQPYDTSPKVVNTTYQRSIYYTADAYPLPLKIEEFLDEAKREVPVVLHVHGCLGVQWDEQRLGTFYAEQKVNIVMLDFMKLEGRKPSCEAFQGFKKIYVSGHSEGGRTVQGVKADVAGVFIYSMDCKISMRHFWTPNPNNQIKVFISSRDPWLDYPQVSIRGCKSLFDRQVSEYWSNQNSHGVLLEKEWRDVLARELKH